MIREILTPEAQRDPYAWASVLLAHAALGAAGWAAIGWWAVLVYVAFEVAQALAARRLYAWDSILDACGFTCGALLGHGLWSHDARLTGAGIAVAACIAVAGWRARA